MSEAPLHHSINYVELTVTDLAAAKAFYGAAFGWTFTDYGPGYAGIRALSTAPEGAPSGTLDGAPSVAPEDAPGGTPEVGGLALADEAKPAGGPFVILYSDNLDCTAGAIRAAGGSIVQGPYEFPGGRRLHFTDPSGNELGVWSPV